MTTRRLWCCALMLGVLAPGGAIVAVEQAVAQARGGKADPKRELDQLQRQLEQKKRQQQSSAKKERSVLEELERLDRKVQLNRRQMALLDRRLREQSEEAARLSAEVAALAQTVGELRHAVGARLRAVYMAGTYGEWGLLLGAGDYQDLMVRLDALQRVAKQEAGLLTQYQHRRGELEAKLQAQNALSEKMRRSRGELASTLDEIGTARAGKRTLLAKVRTEQSVASKAIEELEEAAKQLQELLKRLEQEEKRRKTEGRLAQAKGRLPWPQEGEVVGLFGRQRHSQYNTDIFRRGIEIRSAEGKPVKAVHQGVVAYADWFKGYGLVIVLDHGDHYYTLYAHLGKVAVKIGEAVDQGEVIGEIGETGLGNESSLYFELRHHGTPLDPLGWLKKRGKG